MSYGLRFYTDRDGVSNGSTYAICMDIPPLTSASDCTMRTCSVIIYYQYPGKPEREYARELFEWAKPSPEDRGGLHNATTGPKVLIIGHEPKFGPRSR